jgi:tripartite-type tricarboxylate transporter receptor subunit TctC
VGSGKNKAASVIVAQKLEEAHVVRIARGYAPKGISATLRAQLAAEVAKAAATPEFMAKMESLGFQAKTGTPAEFDAYLKTDQSK